MNGSVVVLLLAGCAAYVFLMSLLGKWLGYSGRHSSEASLQTSAGRLLHRDLVAESREQIAS